MAPAPQDAAGPKSVLTLRVDPAIAGRIERMAREAGTTKSKLGEMLIERGLDVGGGSDDTHTGRGAHPSSTGAASPRGASRPPAVDVKAEEWIRRKARRLHSQGMPTPTALRLARREWAARA